MLQKKKLNSFEFCTLNSLEEFVNEQMKFMKVDTSELGSGYWVLTSANNTFIIKKIKADYPLLKNFADSHYGIISGRDDVLITNKIIIHEKELEKNFLRKIIFPQNILNWIIEDPTQFIIYPYALENDDTLILKKNTIIKEAPNLYKYLTSYKKELESRKDSRRTFKNREDWYGLVRFSSINIFDLPKIVSPTIVKHNRFALDTRKNAFAGGKTVVLTTEKLDLHFLLGILNSRLAEFYYHNVCPVKAGGYFNYSATFVLELPIKVGTRAEQNTIIEIVKKILQIVGSNGYSQNSLKQAKVKEYERQIDQMVYELYGLTREEIKIVEGGQ